MKDTIYLIINRNRITGMFKKPSRTNAGEVVVRVVVEVPDSHFDHYVPTVTLHLPEKVEITESDINVEFGVAEGQEEKDDDYYLDEYPINGY